MALPSFNDPFNDRRRMLQAPSIPQIPALPSIGPVMPGAPASIIPQPPQLPMRQLASTAPIPMLQLGDATNGNVTGQFPDVPDQMVPGDPSYGPPPMGGMETYGDEIPMGGMEASTGMPTTPPLSADGESQAADSGYEASTSGYRSFAGGPSENPAAADPTAASRGGSMIDTLTSRNFMRALGLGLIGLGGPYGQPTALMDVTRRQMLQDEDAQGLRQALTVMNAASGAQTADEGLRMLNAAAQNYRGGSKGLELLIAARAKLADKAYQERTATREAAIMRTLGPGAFREDVFDALYGAGIVPSEGTRSAAATRPERFAKGTTADGQPILIDWKDGRVRKAGESKDWTKIENVNGVLGFADRETGNFIPIGGAAKIGAGDRLDVFQSGRAPMGGGTSITGEGTPARVPTGPGGLTSTTIASRPPDLGTAFNARARSLGIDPEKATSGQVGAILAELELKDKTSFQDILDAASTIDPQTGRSALAQVNPLLDEYFQRMRVQTSAGGVEGAQPVTPFGVLYNPVTQKFEKGLAGSITDAKQTRELEKSRETARAAATVSEEVAQGREARKAAPNFAAGYKALDQLEALIPAMTEKKFLATGPSAFAYWRAEGKRSKIPGLGEPGDADLKAWDTHQGTMVTIMRALGDLNARSKSAYDAAIKLLGEATTPEAARQVFKQLREMMDAARAEYPALPPRPGAPAPAPGPGAPAPGGPAPAAPTPTPPPAGSKTLTREQYNQIRQKYSDDQIRAKGYVIP